MNRSECSHRAGRETGRICQLSGRRLLAQIDQVEAFKIGRMKSEAPRDGKARQDEEDGKRSNSRPQGRPGELGFQRTHGASWRQHSAKVTRSISG